jgi:hypothetical protein
MSTGVCGKDLDVKMKRPLCLIRPKYPTLKDVGTPVAAGMPNFGTRCRSVLAALPRYPAVTSWFISHVLTFYIEKGKLCQSDPVDRVRVYKLVSFCSGLQSPVTGHLSLDTVSWPPRRWKLRAVFHG